MLWVHAWHGMARMGGAMDWSTRVTSTLMQIEGVGIPKEVDG